MRNHMKPGILWMSAIELVVSTQLKNNSKKWEGVKITKHVGSHQLVTRLNHPKPEFLWEVLGGIRIPLLFTTI